MPPNTSRLVFVDLLRGWATLVMVEVHVVNAFVLAEYRDLAWFDALNYVNGLVAPAFIFVSGLVFVYVSARKVGEFRALRGAFRKQLLRIGQVLAIGYLLHLPYFSWQRTLHETTKAGWLKFYQADVLHCIAIGLLTVFLLRLLIHSDTTYRRSLLILGTLVVLATPFLWETDFTRWVWPPVAAYINGFHYSQFPLFLWVSFLFAGGYLAGWYLDAKASGVEETFFRRLLWAGVILSVGGFLGAMIPLAIPYASTEIRADPLFFAERLGVILCLLWLCRWYAVRRRTERSFVLDVSRESLVVYAAHLLLIYGMFFNDRSLAFLYGKTFSLPEAGAATLFLMVAMVLLAKAWSWLKQDHRVLARGTLVWGWGIFAYLYVMR